MTVAVSQFREVMSAFATGVTIVTTGSEGRYHGMTANAFASVSLEPELVLICIDKSANTHPFIGESGLFNVNILREEQEDLARVFADKRSKERHSLDGVEYRLGMTDVPVIAGCLAAVECRVVARYEAGDHTIFVGEVLAAEMGEAGRPLLFYRSRYGRVAD